MVNHAFNRLVKHWPPGQLAAARQGYLEAVAGQPPVPAMLLHPDPAEAIAYENARLWGLNIRAAGIAPPPWRRLGGNLPPAVARAMAEARAKLGPAAPPLRLEF